MCGIAPTLLILHSDSCSLQTKVIAAATAFGIMASQGPCGAEGVGLKLSSDGAEESNDIWFHRNCFKPPV